MRIHRYKLSLTVADSGTTVTSSALPCNGILRGIIVVAPALTSDVNYTVSLLDSDLATIYTKGTITHNATTTIFTDANNLYLKHPIFNDSKLQIVAAGAQTGAKVFTVVLYYSN